MSEKLNVLVLHNLGDPSNWRNSVVDKELCLPRFAPEHNYLIHDFDFPVRDEIRSLDFDVAILTATFLSKRRDPKQFKRITRQYGFLEYKPCVKIALPQDDYECSKILDQWMCKWKVDIVYTVCEGQWDVLYPEYSLCGEIRQGYTGYVSDALIHETEFRKPIAERQIDVGYRAAALSPAFGRMGQVKAQFGDRFEEMANGLSLKLDISTRPEATILGSKWFDFVSNCRCMLGTNSGSSLLDPEGIIAYKVSSYLRKNPKAKFHEVEAACFPGQDGLFDFTAISPRNIECALLGTAQILAPGPYGDFLKPCEHFIPLRPDMSNFGDVVPLIRDHQFLQTMADRCRDAVLSYHQLRYEHHVRDLIETIRERSGLSDAERNRSAPLIKSCQILIDQKAPSFWLKQRLNRVARMFLGDLGIRKVKYLLLDLIDSRPSKKSN